MKTHTSRLVKNLHNLQHLDHVNVACESDGMRWGGTSKPLLSLLTHKVKRSIDSMNKVQAHGKSSRRTVIRSIGLLYWILEKVTRRGVAYPRVSKSVGLIRSSQEDRTLFEFETHVIFRVNFRSNASCEWTALSRES